MFGLLVISVLSFKARIIYPPISYFDACATFLLPAWQPTPSPTVSSKGRGPMEFRHSSCHGLSQPASVTQSLRLENWFLTMLAHSMCTLNDFFGLQT